MHRCGGQRAPGNAGPSRPVEKTYLDETRHKGMVVLLHGVFEACLQRADFFVHDRVHPIHRLVQCVLYCTINRGLDGAVRVLIDLGMDFGH
ncbi:hypothetical protein AURDEDRAFT_113520 [Auricularia subglabra TFB-10046 SS5]|nr:hypothetical protein AURDEDRAFT_113520 [Auricularia subglabra TFB-10046 SS5]